MPKSKRIRLERASQDLRCQFSECTDVCKGMNEFSSHVREHLRLMAEQLNQFNETVSQSTSTENEYGMSLSLTVTYYSQSLSGTAAIART